MTDAIDDLLRTWRGRREDLSRQVRAAAAGLLRESIEHEWSVLDSCIAALGETADGVHPRPLTEAEVEKLYRWAPRLVRILDLMIVARECVYEPDAAIIAGQLADLADRPFLNDVYDLFAQLSNRRVP